MLTEGFFRLAMTAANSNVEVTFRQLFLALELDAELSTLERLTLVERALEGASLAIRPGFQVGDLDTVRLLIGRTEKALNEAMLLDQIKPGEGAFVEFKQSAFFDWKRFNSQPNAPVSELQSEGVTFALLKTVAAFLNSNGGKLFVGVKDDSSLCGIEKDFPYCKSHNEDGWQLKIRDLIKGRFHEGDSINNYIDINVTGITGCAVARIGVSKRSMLSFLKDKDGFHLFSRQGNRTIEIGIEGVEEFLINRSTLR